MKRLDVLMPSRNSYSDVMLGWPSSMMTALAVVPPMSNTIVSFSPRACARREPADHAARRPGCHDQHRLFACARTAATMPPFEVITSTGAAMPMLAQAVLEPLQVAAHVPRAGRH